MIDWQQIINKFSQSIFILDQQGQITAVNQAARSFLKKPLENPMDSAFLDSVKFNVFPFEHLSTTQPKSFQIPNPQNPSNELLVQIDPLFDNSGNINGRYLSIEPLSTQNSLEQQLADAKQQIKTAVETKTSFLDIVSHELRTPLNAVTGHINMLRNTNLDTEQVDLVKSIIENGDKLSDIIKQLLEYSHADSTHYELHPTPFNLNSLLNDIISKYISTIHDKPITIKWAVSEQCPKVLMADPIRIRQLFSYLLDNAIKYTDEGKIDILANVHHNENGTLALEISIRDSGIGISDSIQNQIFQPFNQNDTSLTRKYEGLGISLAIAKRICEHMNGDLTFSSQEGAGSTFTFTISVETSDIEPIESHSNNNLELRDKRILIIGHNANHRRTISRDAKLASMYPYVASTPSEAQYWISKDTFDIVCIEETLLSDATDLLNDLKKLNKSIAFILIEENSVAELENIHFDGVLKTPFTSSEIYDIFIRSLHASRNQKSAKTAELNATDKMADHHPLKIILVEDNMINKKVAERMLKRLGYSIDHAGNGQLGLDMVLENKYDVVLMDIQMPVMDGITATKKIRQMKKDCEQPRIIAVTAHAREGDREKYISCGMDDYISKPIKMDTLVEALYASSAIPIIEDEFTSLKKQEVEEFANGINFEILNNLFGDDVEEFLSEMVPVFLEDSERILHQLKSAIPLGDSKTIKEASHALKGSSASLGMENLSNLCGQLEKGHQTIGHSAIENLFLQIRVEHKQICEYLTSKYIQVPV